jgi:hypothetical protein
MNTMGSMTIRRALDRLWMVAAGTSVALIVAACELVPVGGAPPIPAGPVGPVVQNPGGGAPVECRGIPIQQCQQSAGDLPSRPDVVRVIVTCTKVCTPTEGEYRLDYVTVNGRVEQAGGGGYASAPAAAPGEPEPVPAPT